MAAELSVPDDGESSKVRVSRGGGKDDKKDKAKGLDLVLLETLAATIEVTAASAPRKSTPAPSVLPFLAKIDTDASGSGSAMPAPERAARTVEWIQMQALAALGGKQAKEAGVLMGMLLPKQCHVYSSVSCFTRSMSKN